MSRFDQIIPRAGSGCLKYDHRQGIFGTEAVMPLWVADMDFAVPDAVQQALQARTRHPVWGYGLRDDAMGEAFATWADRRHRWSVEPEWVCPSPGVVPSMVQAILAFTVPGDGIIVQPPIYPPFFAMVEENGRRLLSNPLLLETGRYQMDFEGLVPLLEQARMLMLCSPHNPTGRVWQREELARLIELCDQADVLLLSDEIHWDLVYPGATHIPAATLSDRIITLASPGKTFNIAGITPSVTVIADEDLRQRFQLQLKASHLGDGNVLGDAAFLAAYHGGESWLDDLLPYLATNLDLIRRRLPESIQLIEPEATFLAWLDCRALAYVGDALNRFFIEQAGLGLSPGAIFGNEGQGFMRLNFALPRQQLARALDGMVSAVVKASFSTERAG